MDTADSDVPDPSTSDRVASDPATSDTVASDFDAADLAEAILGPDAPMASIDVRPAMQPPPRLDSPPGKYLGWLLLGALAVALNIAISLAFHLDKADGSPAPPPCGGIYDECCVDDWHDDRWPDEGEYKRHLDRNDRSSDGLFDAEERFADTDRSTVSYPPRC